MADNECSNDAVSYNSVCMPSSDTKPLDSDEEQPCTTDAGHPRFQRKKKNLEFCYCPNCDEYIQDKEFHRERHIASSDDRHVSVNKCLYCQRGLYLFKRNGKDVLHHMCNYDDSSLNSTSVELSPSSSGSVPSTSSLVSNNMYMDVINGKNESLEILPQASVLSVSVPDHNSIPK